MRERADESELGLFLSVFVGCGFRFAGIHLAFDAFGSTNDISRWLEALKHGTGSNQQLVVRFGCYAPCAQAFGSEELIFLIVGARAEAVGCDLRFPTPQSAWVALCGYSGREAGLRC
jgi:hypothetical protein